jgi:hypothetical protein
MVEFFNTNNKVTVMRNQQLLIYPFPLIVKIEAVDKGNGIMRALSFNYFNNDEEVDEFIADLDDEYGMEVEDQR